MNMLIPTRRTPLLLLILSILHGIAFYRFHVQDHRLADGDVFGHEGAIELFSLVSQDRGFFAAILDTLNSGADYPPLHALLSGMAWHLIFGQNTFPEGLWLINYMGWLGTLLLIVLAGNRLGKAPLGLIAGVLWSFYPLATALARVSMPEPWVALWVSATVYALALCQNLKSPSGTAFLALSVMAGLLSKQTYAIYVFVPLLHTLFVALKATDRKKRLLWAGVCALIVTLPIGAWYVPQLQSQGSYLAGSVGNRSGASWLEHVLYYPTALVGHGISPLIAITTLPWILWPQHSSKSPRNKLLLWTLGGLVLLILIPKKYPRLLLPLLPLIALLSATGLQQLWTHRSASTRPILTVILTTFTLLFGLQRWSLGPGFEQLEGQSFLYYPDLVLEDLDPNCFQRWIEPPHPSEMHFSALNEALRETLLPEELREEPVEGQGRILWLSEPSIPCAYQSTFSYREHLSAAIRRSQLDPGFVVVAEQEPEQATSVLSQRWLRLVISDEPWDCAAPTPEQPALAPWLQETCAWRAEYATGPQWDVQGTDLAFTLYTYQRRSRFR